MKRVSKLLGHQHDSVPAQCGSSVVGGVGKNTTMYVQSLGCCMTVASRRELLLLLPHMLTAPGELHAQPSLVAKKIGHAWPNFPTTFD